MVLFMQQEGYPACQKYCSNNSQSSLGDPPQLGETCEKLAVKQQESPAVTDKHARRLRKVCTVYVRAVGL